MRACSTNSKGHQVINNTHSQLSEWNGILLPPLRRQPCVFNILGFPSAYLQIQGPLCPQQCEYWKLNPSPLEKQMTINYGAISLAPHFGKLFILT